MSEVLEGAVCGIDGCTPAASDHFGLASDAKATLLIEVISDAICPCQAATGLRDRGDLAGRHCVGHLASFRTQPGHAQGWSGPARLPLGQVWVLAALPGARRAGRSGRTVGGARVQA